MLAESLLLHECARPALEAAAQCLSRESSCATGVSGQGLAWQHAGDRRQPTLHPFPHGHLGAASTSLPWRGRQGGGRRSARREVNRRARGGYEEPRSDTCSSGRAVPRLLGGKAAISPLQRVERQSSAVAGHVRRGRRWWICSEDESAGSLSADSAFGNGIAAADVIRVVTPNRGRVG